MFKLKEKPTMINFINILRACFSYKRAFCKKVTREKHFRAKNERVKCWWNQHLNIDKQIVNSVMIEL